MKEQITTSYLSPFLPVFLQTGLICEPIAFPFLPVYDTKKAEFFEDGEMARIAAIGIQDFETIVLLDLHSKRKMC